jgi:hypothetical protein
MKAANARGHERETGMAGENEAARQALQDVPRHNDPAVVGRAGRCQYVPHRR